MACAGRCPSLESDYKDQWGVNICVAFQKGRCNNELMDGGCATTRGVRRHICAVIRSVNPWQLCAMNHAAMQCVYFQGRSRQK